MGSLNRREGKEDLVSYVSLMAARKGNSKERYERITRYLEAAGSYRVPDSVKEEFADTFGVTKRQIMLDINKLLEKIIRPKLNRISGQFTLTLNSNLDDAHKLKRDSDPLIQVRGISSANQTIATYTDFLEKFGFKELVVQKHEFEGLAGTFNLITKTNKEIKDAKNRNKGKGVGDKRKTERDNSGT